MRVLVACEFSGRVRDAFTARGHDAWSCDLLPSESPGNHIQGDVTPYLNDDWDLLIAHPPCTYLASSGLHWNYRVLGREKLTEKAMQFVLTLMEAPIPKIALENPKGRIGTAYRQADQMIQPYNFGHDASKQTFLWLKNLPPLQPTQIIQPRMVGKNRRYGNQYDNGQSNLSASAARQAKRSVTYQGIANAMAATWG